jgi:ribonuclease E
MATRMLIDARHPEETRVAVLKGNRIEEFDFESADHKQIKGNIYLAKVTRVEPSLQAAFVDFGGNRHGFLAFSEIHPDYYQIPKADREALLAEEAAHAEEEAALRAAEDGEDEWRKSGDDDYVRQMTTMMMTRKPRWRPDRGRHFRRRRGLTIEAGHVENGDRWTGETMRTPSATPPPTRTAKARKTGQRRGRPPWRHAARVAASAAVPRKPTTCARAGWRCAAATRSRT